MVCHSTVRRTSSTNQKVGRPPDEKMEKGLESSPHSNSSFFAKSRNENIAVLERWPVVSFSAFFGDMGLAEFHVICVLMVNSMGSLPTVIRNQKQGVQDVSYSVLEFSVLGKGAVTTFVSQNPQSHGNRSGDTGVGRPKGEVRQASWVENTEHPCAEKRAKGGSHNGNT